MRKKLKVLALGCLAWSAFSASIAQAEVVASYEFTGGSLTSSDTAADSTASPITVVNAASVTNSVNYTANQTNTTAGSSNVNFTVTPSTSLTFTSFAADFTVAGLTAGNAFTVDFLVNGTSVGSLSIGFNGAVHLAPSFSQTYGASTTFQINVTDNGFNGAGKTISIDNVQVTAQAVPLPDAMAMFFSGMPCLIAAGWYAQRKAMPRKPA
jgi:hypothetical protein